MYYSVVRINRNLTTSQMTHKNQSIHVYLFNNPEADTYSGESREEAEARIDRTMELNSRTKAIFQKRSMKDELSTLDVVISSNLLRARELAKILSEGTINTEKKREARQHIEDNLEITGVMLNNEHQPVIVINSISDVVSRIADTIESLLVDTKLLIVLDKESLWSLARRLMRDNEIEVDLDFGQGVLITLNETREIKKIH